MRQPILFPLFLCLAACGGGGGEPRSDPAPDSPGPDIALLLANGHSFDAAPNYLAVAAGPFLAEALTAAGYTVETTSYPDDLVGYAALLQKLETVREEWIAGRSDPTRIVVVAHSHGGVRAHAAIRASPTVPIRLLVDLDTSSNGWPLVHPGEDDELGGAPINAHRIEGAGGCPDFPLLPNEQGVFFDVEDVVFENVTEAYEVRTGDVVPNPLQFEYYDERWNARPDGTQGGLTCWYSATLHSEPTLPDGQTLPRVRDWILERLGSDP